MGRLAKETERMEILNAMEAYTVNEDLSKNEGEWKKVNRNKKRGKIVCLRQKELRHRKKSNKVEC